MEDFVEFTEHLSTRLLRGGSGSSGGGSSGGSRGGGSSYSGGSSNYYGGNRGCSSYDTNCTTSSNNVNAPGWVVGIIFGAVFGIICCGGCCFMNYARKKGLLKNPTPGSDDQFDSAVSEARRGITYKSSGVTPSDVRFKSYSATFDAEYTDRNNTMQAVLEIQLQNDGFSGYTIDGSGSDADGQTKLTDGFVTYSGNAWWLEETLTGPDAGLKVLSQGEFNFETNTFTGTWRSNSKCDGTYTSFVARNVMSTNSDECVEQGIPVVYATTDADIPVSFASEEAPVVIATPEPMPYVVGSL